MYCPKCGKQNADESLFCTACGGKLNGETLNEEKANEEKTNEEKAPAADASVGEVFKKIEDNAVPFVAKTGTYIKDNAVPLAEKTAGFTKEKAKKISKMSFKKFVKIIVILIVAVTVFCVVFMKGDEAKIKGVANNFVEALNHNDIEDFVKCFEPSIQEQSLKKINGMLALFGDDYELKDMLNISEEEDIYVSVTDITITEDTAKAKFNYYIDGEKKSSDNVNLIKIKGKWYVGNTW